MGQIILNKSDNNTKISFFDFCIITLFVLFNAAAASFINNDIFTFICFICVLVIFFYKSKKIDNYFVVFLLIWVLINFISGFVINTSSDLIFGPFLGKTCRMLMPYFILKIIGQSFFDKFFKYAYTLVLLSFPFWLLESFFPEIIERVVPYLNFMTQREQVLSGGFYIFVYMHSGWAKNLGLFVRNSGFMWEPGAYSCVLVFLLVYHFCKIDYKIDKKIIVLSLAIISTFSTAGYVALFIVYIFFLVKNKALRHKYWFLLPFFLIGYLTYAVYFYNTSEFMREKIEGYIERDKDTHNWEFEGQRILRVSRWGIIKISVENALRRPWGEGVYTSEYILKKYGPVSGPSATADILRQWGWLGLFVLCISLYNFRVENKKMGWFMILPMFVVLSSNPFNVRFLVFIIVFYYLSISSKSKYKIYKN